ncbi:chromosome segregation protein SMC [Paenibacillus psychroresistens]|uniref:Chromosome partition protein Smc n=1 Tax=Paenibacillus psychroresistens TaxID=1778678 RepID=A0A6B8RW29_9BACL|nr:chromosome segregation protein SMC [Paenibacillus psychroresistens]QGR00113.1 chromosome segregation protein SMC [Paenibacillus psychroresistens]
MFLKRIELTGFKSFADKTELEFVQGITAVVGPNGSGKSNISDGIRWVLGEQSAKSLRGGKMEDVIFAGSDARKAVNYGEVSLTLDNQDHALPLDFSEVTVTRRVHRSGESEYLINKQSCRLKDITELFMDTGIGKEAYSIIGQGRIEEILSTKSEDRRGIFEEASGIVKYKSRKKETEKKLSDTEQNLLRIHDLVSELEDQVEPLRDQSEKAFRFKALKDELKNSEISLYVHQIEQMHISWQDTNDKLARLQVEQLTFATVVNQHDAQLEKHRWETKRLDEELEKLHAQLLQISEEYDKCEGQGEVLKERHKYLSANLTRDEQTIAVQTKRLADKQLEMDTFKLKMDQVSALLVEHNAQLRAEEERLLGVVGGLSSEAEENLKSELLETLNQIAQSRNEIRYVEQQLETIGRRGDRLEEERKKWNEQKEGLAKRKAALTIKLAEISTEISQTRDNYIALSNQLKTKQGLYEEILGTIRRWEQKLDALVSRSDTMREMQNDYDGFQQGVKEVLKAKDRPDGLKGIHGAVAELIKVPADVELAIETTLGGALQNIVVANEANGREAINFLKRRQLGRATFLPLDVIKGRTIGDHERRGIEGSPGYVGIAVNLVKFDAKYEQIFSSLLGNVVVAKTLEDANHLAAKVQYRFRVVTLEGDVVHPGGSMTGGSQHKKTTSLLGRQRQIDEMVLEIAQSKAQLKQLQEKAEEAKAELLIGSRQLEELRQQGELKRIEEQQFVAEMNPLENEAQTMEDQLYVAEQDNVVLGEEVTQFAGKKLAAEVTLQQAERKEVELSQAIRDAELARKASESAKEELQAQLTELKVKAAASTQEKQSLMEQQQRMQADYREIRDELEANHKQIQQLNEEIAICNADTVKQLEQMNDHKLKKQACTEKTDFTRAERVGWMQKLETAENETKEQRIALKRVEEDLHHTEVRSTRLDVELDHLLKKLSEEYELSFELAKSRYALPEDVNLTQIKVKEIKREITSLGDVNLGAIEEFTRISERYEFLNEQKHDLMEAKATLYEVIREMDEEMSKRFTTTFELIRTQFEIVFSKLFGGGRADLILSEPSHPLDTGIEIIAQPPGKKLQNLQLLSGGERALTAIALLFAILRIKPVPFCVLDEVEAALDEANVSRFAEYLREFSHETQFIVVTHRKGTMEEADVLYGVTMEEGGVSKLVSVRLEDRDEQLVPA